MWTATAHEMSAGSESLIGPGKISKWPDMMLVLARMNASMTSSVFCIVKSCCAVAEPDEPVFASCWKMSLSSLLLSPSTLKTDSFLLAAAALASLLRKAFSLPPPADLKAVATVSSAAASAVLTASSPESSDSSGLRLSILLERLRPASSASSSFGPPPASREKASTTKNCRNS